MGSGSSFTILSSTSNTKTNSEIITDDSTDKSSKLPQIISQEKIQKSIKQKQKRLENFEPFTLIYLDNDFDDNDKKFQSTIDFICCFNDLEQCEQFILNKNKNEHLFFIVSSQYATNIVSHVHDLTQIIAIYILQQDISNINRKDTIDDKWTKRYSKVKGIYLDRDSLLEELSSDVNKYTNIGDLLPISIYNQRDIIQNNNSSNDHLRFLFYQLFVHEYCLKSSSSNKIHLIELIEDYYRLNRYELHQIDEFDKEYNSTKNVLIWFLRNTFLRKFLTKSLLILNLKILFTLRFFIKDMYKAMIDIGSSSNKYQISTEQIFYRSQIISEETFGRIKSNIGELLSINNFFLANKNRHNALSFLRQNFSSTNLIYRVLFEIKIPSDYKFHKQRPFIDVTQFSSDEYTTLFFIGSIFRIDTVIFDINNDCWIIQLTLYDERTNEDFSQVFTFLNDHHTPITLANLLRRICPDSAKQFYKHLLKENSESPSRLECYRGLGLCSYSCEDYEQALIYFEKALEMEPDDPLIISSLHNSIGLVYAQQDNLDQAQIHFSEALKYSSLPLHVACAHYNLALVYGKQCLFDEELDHYQEAFEIRTNQLPSDHLQIASLFNNIGIAYSDLHKHDKALSNLRKALEMRLKLLPENHIDVARSYANIGAVYVKTEEFRMALEYFNKAQLLFEKQQPIPEQDIQQINQNIKIVNEKLE
ncbi:unnamed protein product [Rotaria sordida]|uniref:Uncharacterized protein n=1 Tax=Rotaria sordida TaxID=392033 RepID=A0A814N710_9BILA|nr:unnamed protein product [Rotaria sordida]CAF1281310.1 unnamed protein product [Rotaria sordida]